MGDYIKPVQAFKKMEAASLLRQTVYICGATGYGKTELILRFLKNQPYIYIPCQQNYCDLSPITDDCEEIVVIDNINAIEDEELRSAIAALFGRKKLRLILAGRSRMPSWLFDSFMKHSVMVITEDELALSADDIDRYMRSEGIILTEDDIGLLHKWTEGNLIGIKYAAQMLSEGETVDRELYEKNLAMVQRFYEETIVSAMSSELVDFLMKVSIVDDFTEQLAVMLTGNPACAA